MCIGRGTVSVYGQTSAGRTETQAFGAYDPGTGEGNHGRH